MAMMVITVMVAGYRDEGGQKIDVEEGHEEIDLEYMPRLDMGKTYQNETTGEWYKNATAMTYVDGKNNSLKFEVIAESIAFYSEVHEIDLKLRVEGDFKQKYDQERLLFQMQELNGKKSSRNHQDFDNTFVKENKVDLWPEEKYKSGSTGTRRAFIGFDIDENKFSAEGHVTWRIPRSNWNNSYTLRLQSVVKGMSEDVTTTVDVNIQERGLK
ncbi:MAG: hypothetical protein ACQESD_00370 [Thermoplasmatota archaeon]